MLEIVAEKEIIEEGEENEYDDNDDDEGDEDEDEDAISELNQEQPMSKRLIEIKDLEN